MAGRQGAGGGGWKGRSSRLKSHCLLSQLIYVFKSRRKIFNNPGSPTRDGLRSLMIGV